MLGKILLSQFESVKDMIVQALEKGDDRFNETVNDWSYNWTLYHIIEAIDFYMQYSPEGFKWGQVAEINWETMSDETIAQKKKLITRERMQKYLNDIWPIVQEKVKIVKIEDTDDFEYSESVFDKYLFLLRHTVQHLGELGKTLRDWKCARLKSIFKVEKKINNI